MCVCVCVCVCVCACACACVCVCERERDVCVYYNHVHNYMYPSMFAICSHGCREEDKLLVFEVSEKTVLTAIKPSADSSEPM